MAKAKAKKRAVKRIVKDVKKAVSKGLEEEMIEQAVQEGLNNAPKRKVLASKKKPAKVQTIKGKDQTRRKIADDSAE